MGYKYRDIPLVAAVMYDLILECFPGRSVDRTEIVTKTTELHLSRGGKPCQGDVQSSLNTALTNLQKNDLAHRVVSGYWRILPEEIGSGESTVYVYYFPTFKQNAKQEGRDYWECKVGKTTQDVDSRMKQQTGIPEKAVVTEIKTDDPDQLEKALHAMLKARGRHKEEAPGTEWFITSPREVYEMFCLLTYFPKLSG